MVAEPSEETARAATIARPWRAGTAFAWAALGVVLVAFGLRVIRLDRPLWFDEGYSIFFASASPWETARLTASDIHPPLYYWFLQAWTVVVGWNEVAVRVASTAVGVVTIAVLMRFGRRAAGPIVPLSAGLILALSPFHIAYSQEVRMYALLALLATLSTWAWWRLAYGGRWGVSAYAVATAAALLTQYYAVFLVVGQAVSLAFLGRAGRRRRLVALGAAVAPFAAWSAFAAPALLAYVRGKVASEGYTPLMPAEFLIELMTAFGGGGPLATAAGAALVTLGVFGLLRRGVLPSVRIILACSLVAVVGLGWVVNLVAPFHPPQWQRLFLFVAPLLLFAAASGFWRLLRPTLRRAPPLFGWVAPNGLVRAAGLICLGLTLGGTAPGLAILYARAPSDDPRPMIRLINALSRPDDLVIAVYPWQVGYLQLYHPRPLPTIALAPADRWARDADARAAELRVLAEGRPRVWLPAYQRLGHRLEDALEQDLNDRWFLISTTWFGDHRLLVYGDGALSSAPVTARFRDGVRVVATAGQTATAGSGVIPVLMQWTSERPLPAGSVHLRLVDDRGV
ncbi:MAG: glycosyltransferase family 39 protein, partial [Dehalococcoidia bacterium]|nr:glycosyltransferase family 39 protein [Dehalococcoidia bacterium]